jgi:hypothetical protein
MDDSLGGIRRPGDAAVRIVAESPKLVAPSLEVQARSAPLVEW